MQKKKSAGRTLMGWNRKQFKSGEVNSLSGARRRSLLLVIRQSMMDMDQNGTGATRDELFLEFVFLSVSRSGGVAWPLTDWIQMSGVLRMILVVSSSYQLGASMKWGEN